MKIPRILLAEDNENDIELILNALKEFNLINEITTVRDGVAALDFLSRRGDFKDIPVGNPAVVLLDLKMPRMGGLEVIKAMKKDPKLKLVPIVVLTSSKLESDLMESYSLGVNAYVVKPVDFNEFMTAIKSIGVFWAILNETPVR